MEGKKILICEDEQDSLKIIQGCLAKRDYKVFIASDGQAAVDKCKSEKPDLILMDIRMPKLSGIDALKKIREDDKKVKILFITAFQSPQLSQEAAKYDICGYIIKPASPEVILSSIEKALA